MWKVNDDRQRTTHDHNVQLNRLDKNNLPLIIWLVGGEGGGVKKLINIWLNGVLDPKYGNSTTNSTAMKVKLNLQNHVTESFYYSEIVVPTENTTVSVHLRG